jgi:hypothetical protein
MAASSRATAIGPSTPSHASLTDALWIKAVEKLSEEDKRDIDFTRIDKLSILEDVLAAVEEGKQICIKRRWKYKKGDHEVIIRDKLEKTLTWVNKFKEVGDTVMQYDPGHAALPWAGVRFLIQVSGSHLPPLEEFSD